MTALTDAQIAAWRRDGYLHSFPLLDADERRACLDGVARYENWLGGKINGFDDLGPRTMTYLLLPWVARLARDPRILDKVEQLIGPDIVIWTSTFFIKEANSPTLAAWHQDATYMGLEPMEMTTAWVALTDADEEAGCMEMSPWGGAWRQLRHQTRVVENSVNRAAQMITEAVDERATEMMPLKAGRFSFHHGMAIHRSAPNCSDHRRIGLGLNYLPTRSKGTGSIRTAAMLVRGEDRYGHFELVGPPSAECAPDAVAVHERATGLYRDNYLEHERLHPEGAQ